MRAFDKSSTSSTAPTAACGFGDAVDNFATPKDYPLRKTGVVDATQGNPHDIFVDNATGKAYVSLYGSFGSTQVKSHDGARGAGSEQPRCWISSFVTLTVNPADTDGNPDASQLVGCGGSQVCAASGSRSQRRLQARR